MWLKCNIVTCLFFSIVEYFSLFKNIDDTTPYLLFVITPCWCGLAYALGLHISFFFFSPAHILLLIMTFCRIFHVREASSVPFVKARKRAPSLSILEHHFGWQNNVPFIDSVPTVSSAALVHCPDETERVVTAWKKVTWTTLNNFPDLHKAKNLCRSSHNLGKHESPLTKEIFKTSSGLGIGSAKMKNPAITPFDVNLLFRAHYRYLPLYLIHF